MTTVRRIARNPDVASEIEAEIERERLAALERELAAEQTFQQACETFRSALDAYAATYPQGLDYFDPDSELGRALDLAMDIHHATIRGLRDRMKESRVKVRRKGERRLA